MVGRPSRAVKPRIVISSQDLLSAVDEHGPLWPATFGDQEIVSVTEAVDRELLAGTLVDATHLSPAGRALLDGTQPE